MPYPTKKLGEVCEISAGGSAPQGERFFENGEYPFFRTSDVGAVHLSENLCDVRDHLNNEGIKKLNLFKKGTILFPKSGASTFLNHRIIMGCDGYVSSHLATISAGEKVDYKYLYFFLILIDAKDIAPNSSYPSLKISDIAKLEIPLPSLPEQKKIVAKLERVLAKINEAKKLRIVARKNADNFLPAELHKIFSQQHSNILQNVGMSSSGKNGWEEKELGEISDEIKSGFACGKQNEVSNGVVHLRTHNIDTEGNLNFDKITKIPKDLVVQNAFGLERGDILFNNTNSTELVGKTALVTKALPYAFSNHLTRIRINKNKVLSEWIVYVFNIFWKDKYFENICTRWVGQSGINQAALKKIKIPLPPLTEQKKIVARLDSLSEKIASLRQAQAATQNDFVALEQSILSKSMNGELVEIIKML